MTDWRGYLVAFNSESQKYVTMTGASYLFLNRDWFLFPIEINIFSVS